MGTSYEEIEMTKDPEEQEKAAESKKELRAIYEGMASGEKK